jgi:carboxyl-terminal processing protease
MSLYDYYYVRDASNPKDNANREVKLTDDGRTVYGGGGITPDDHIDPIKTNHVEEVLLTERAFDYFTPHYLANRTVQRDFVVDDAVMQDFKAFLKAKKIEVTDQEIADNLDWIKEEIKKGIFTSQFGQAQGLIVQTEWDPQVQKALSYLPQAQALLDQGKSKTVTASAKP